MKITFDYRRPTPAHCAIGVFVNGACAGELTLRQDEIGPFQMIVQHGMTMPGDEFRGTGNPNWQEKVGKP